ncbi:hypothetical protein MANAM107_18880 [Actinomyces capricornis]|uniref:Uncharacterized protein n=1 Tax=Actinomyces capricornis TaxID=2755559 RepID=A0ABN6K5U5_9ACTO|nr:hypothetical protein MANAM107_18880 [Actinomyces capricornis]
MEALTGGSLRDVGLHDEALRWWWAGADGAPGRWRSTALVGHVVGRVRLGVTSRQVRRLAEWTYLAGVVHSAKRRPIRQVTPNCRVKSLGVVFFGLGGEGYQGVVVGGGVGQGVGELLE